MAKKRSVSGAPAPIAPFARPVVVAGLRRDTETPFRIAAEPGELSALAGFLAIDRVDHLSIAGFLTPMAGDEWRVRGRMVAKIRQTCVVTLEPVDSRLDVEVERRFLPAGSFSPTREISVGTDDFDAPDPYVDAIDLAAIAVEALALSIDPYPRASGAELESSSARSSDPEDSIGPFAGLAVLRDGNAKGGG